MLQVAKFRPAITLPRQSTPQLNRPALALIKGFACSTNVLLVISPSKTKYNPSFLDAHHSTSKPQSLCLSQDSKIPSCWISRAVTCVDHNNGTQSDTDRHRGAGVAHVKERLDGKKAMGSRVAER